MNEIGDIRLHHIRGPDFIGRVITVEQWNEGQDGKPYWQNLTTLEPCSSLREAAEAVVELTNENRN